MATLPRSLDDLILDALVAKIKKHRDADKLVDVIYDYDVERDKSSPWQGLRGPLVNGRQNSDEPKGDAYTARYGFLCIVPVCEAADAKAAAKFYTLKEQVKKALLDRADPDLGFEPGTISAIGSLTWQRVEFDDDKLNEEIFAGEWSLEVTYAYDPLDLTLIPLTTLNVNNSGLAAKYTLEED